MKTFCSLLIWISALSALGLTQTDKAAFRITISTDHPIVMQESDVTITVHLKNTSDQTLDLSANISDLTAVNPNYLYDVRDMQGNLAPRRVYKHPELATGHAIFRTVGPGGSVRDSEPIGRLFDMSKPGQYVIQVSKSVPGSDRVVKSNKITVTVNPEYHGKDRTTD
jgi:hypothetical protein